ncbi:MAG: hypothetical protein MJ218_03440 [Opitutales bacterium]|nr:hypothetical protein [Opitutales bacterium]
MVDPITQTQKPIFNTEDSHQLNPNTDTVKKDTQSQRDPLSNPSDNLSKTAQVHSDIFEDSGISLSEKVLEHNFPPKQAVLDTPVNDRNLKASSVESHIGTKADPTMLHDEIDQKTFE